MIFFVGNEDLKMDEQTRTNEALVRHYVHKLHQ